MFECLKPNLPTCLTIYTNSLPNTGDPHPKKKSLVLKKESRGLVGLHVKQREPTSGKVSVKTLYNSNLH
jgi:hypothetical protein